MQSSTQTRKTGVDRQVDRYASFVSLFYFHFLFLYIDPKASGLRIPTAVPPRIVDYPCTWQNSFKEELKK